MADSKRRLRVLHLASFSGNIGDNANHLGTRASFARLLPYEFDYTPLEIREFFWDQRQWDSALVQYINQFDLLQIGGGNYFELWVEKSRTGCSIDLPPHLLAEINIPILFYGLGVDAGQGVPSICSQRFGEFFDAINACESCFVALRNDGAFDTLRRYFPNISIERVAQVPDGGFFYSAIAQAKAKGVGPYSEPSAATIAINLAGDMLETRFPGTADVNSPDISYPEFNRYFADVIVSALDSNPNHDAVLIPHIWRDLDAIHRLIEYLPDSLRRTRIQVAPYKTGDAACHELFAHYRNSDLCLATRFHANVCPIAMGVPTIGLVNYPQIQHLYEELALSEQCIRINRPGFEARLTELIGSALAQPNLFRERQSRAVDCLEENLKAATAKISTWLQAVI